MAADFVHLHFHFAARAENVDLRNILGRLDGDRGRRDDTVGLRFGCFIQILEVSSSQLLPDGRQRHQVQKIRAVVEPTAVSPDEGKDQKVVGDLPADPEIDLAEIRSFGGGAVLLCLQELQPLQGGWRCRQIKNSRGKRFFFGNNPVPDLHPAVLGRHPLPDGRVLPDHRFPPCAIGRFQRGPEIFLSTCQ